MQYQTFAEIPFDEQLEQTLIGQMISDPSSVADVREKVGEDDFYRTDHKKIVREIFRLWSKGDDEVNLTNLVPFTQKEGISVSYLTECAGMAITSAHLPSQIERLVALSSLRKAFDVARQIHGISHYETTEEIKASLEKVTARINQISERSADTDTMMNQSDALLRLAERFDAMYNGEIEDNALMSGISDLDRITNGFRPEELVIIGARPSMGKTAFSLELLNAFSRKGKRSLYFSLEMPTEDMLARMAAAHAGVGISQLKRGLVTPEEYDKVMNGFAIMNEYPIVWDDKPGQTAEQMLAKARKVKREQGLDVIFIDYLGFMGSPAPGMRPYDVVTHNVKAVKAMARELKVPVILLAQLSRANTVRDDKRPQLSDLRESGEVEQTGDQIMFLHREGYYNPEKDDNTLEIIVRKNRNGSLGTARVWYYRDKNIIRGIARQVS
jgi:replicative DNA helicase